MEVPQPSYVTLDDGRKLAYDEVSPANPQDSKGTILLLTGLGSKRLGWERQMADFGREYRTISMDHRDTGDSDEVEAPYSVADLADDASVLLTKLGIARANVVGISLGGFTALQFAVRHPDQLEKLVLVSTSAGGETHVPAGPETLALLAPAPDLEIGERAIRNYSHIMAADFVQAHPEELQHIAEVARYRPMSPAGYMRQLQAAMTHDIAAAIHTISAPTLIIHGDADPLVPPQNGAYLAEHIPGAKHTVYSGVGHIPIVERAAEFNRDVLTFLNGDSAQQASAQQNEQTQPQPQEQPVATGATVQPVTTPAQANPDRGRGPFPFIWRNRKREHKLTE